MIKNTKFYIEGIHCSSCKTLIEAELETLPGVKKIDVDHQNGEAKIEFDDDKIKLTNIFKSLKKLNYTASEKKLLKSKYNFVFPFITLLIIALGYLAISYFGGFELLAELNGKNVGLGIIFVIGLLSGFHCVGMCGGLVVAYSTKQNAKYHSHLKYNSGRIISYTLVGGILGGIGSFFGINPVFTGTITIAAAIFMILLGISYTTKWSIFDKIKLHTPEFIAKFIYKQKQRKNSNTPFIIGLLTGFMPCGPLQAIQLYALSTGDVFQGALSLGVFALGTSVVMFIFGLIISSLSQKNIANIVKVSGVLVIVLGILLLDRGLSNFNFSFLPQNSDSNIKTNQTSKENFQEVRMELNSFGYSPNVLNIKPDIPVRWIIDVKQMSGCTNAIMIESIGIKRDLKYGENIIEFELPKNVKEIKFSCWMRMVWGKFVISENSTQSTSKIQENTIEANGTCNGSCGNETCGAKQNLSCSCGN